MNHYVKRILLTHILLYVCSCGTSNRDAFSTRSDHPTASHSDVAGFQATNSMGQLRRVQLYVSRISGRDCLDWNVTVTSTTPMFQVSGKKLERGDSFFSFGQTKARVVSRTHSAQDGGEFWVAEGAIIAITGSVANCKTGIRQAIAERVRVHIPRTATMYDFAANARIEAQIR